MINEPVQTVNTFDAILKSFCNLNRNPFSSILILSHTLEFTPVPPGRTTISTIILLHSMALNKSSMLKSGVIVNPADPTLTLKEHRKRYVHFITTKEI